MAEDAERERDFAEQREADEHDDGAEGDEHVLPDDRAGALAQAIGGKEVFQPVVHENDLCLLQCCIRTACAHRHAHMRGGEARRVVHAVADILLFLTNEPGDDGHFVFRIQLRADVGKLQPVPEKLSRVTPIARQQHRPEAELTKRGHQLRCLWPEIVPQQNAPDQGVVRQTDFGIAGVGLRDPSEQFRSFALGEPLSTSEKDFAFAGFGAEPPAGDRLEPVQV